MPPDPQQIPQHSGHEGTQDRARTYEEQPPETEGEDDGKSLTTPALRETMPFGATQRHLDAAVAQLVERQLPNEAMPPALRLAQTIRKILPITEMR